MKELEILLENVLRTGNPAHAVNICRELASGRWIIKERK
jgi:hypothetical protein